MNVKLYVGKKWTLWVYWNLFLEY